MKKLNKFLLSSLLLVVSADANDDVLSQVKKDILNYSYEKSMQDSEKLKKDWINPIYYKYIYNNGETYTTKKSFISISQPIFKSGGIYYAIKYANSMKKYSKISIERQKKELIKQTVNLLFQIKKIDITIEKQKLAVKNTLIDVDRKKEQVLNGILDTSFLDNAIIESNVKQNGLIDLQYQKDTLVNQLTTLSDKKYTELELPELKLVDSDNYINSNIYIKEASQDIDNSYWMKNMIKSNYLPTINFTGDYTKYHDTDNNPALRTTGTTNAGFNITIPLDIRFSNSIESSKIEYLQKKVALADKKREELSKYNNAIEKIESIKKKILIANDDIKLYDSLLTQIQEQLNVGMKTKLDVETMENSKRIKELDIKNLQIEKQIELLEIYSRIEN